MEEDKTTQELSESRQAEPEDLAFAKTLLQFFVIPALVVAICVVVFLFFGWMVSEEKTSVDYLREVQTGSASRRWQAAFELAKILNHQPEQARAEGLVPEMVEAFEEANDDDRRVRRYLALAMGHMGDPEAVPALLDGLHDDDAQTRIYSIWALGRAGDGSAVEPLLLLAKHDDPGIRKMAVYSLGALGDERARDVLRAALNDQKLDVSWNAAIALAQLSDDSGKARILQMLDREFMDSVENMNEEQRAEAMMAAVKGAALLGGEDMRRRLDEISQEDPALQVRQAAFEALAVMDPMQGQ